MSDSCKPGKNFKPSGTFKVGQRVTHIVDGSEGTVLDLERWPGHGIEVEWDGFATTYFESPEDIYPTIGEI